MKISVVFLAFLFAVPALAQEETLDPYSKYRAETYEVQKQYLSRLATHQDMLMTDLEEKLKEQKWQTNAVAVMVFFLVFSGVIFSALQFYKDFKSSGQSSVSFKLGASSLELNSTVIGVAILAMSFIFFQSYIDRVYDIKINPMPILDVTTFGVNQ